jgi:hypothetical protein
MEALRPDSKSGSLGGGYLSKILKIDQRMEKGGFIKIIQVGLRDLAKAAATAQAAEKVEFKFHAKSPRRTRLVGRRLTQHSSHCHCKNWEELARLKSAWAWGAAYQDSPQI